MSTPTATRIVNVHTPTSSFSVIHAPTQDSLDALFSTLSRKLHQTVGPGWLKYEYQGSIFNLDDDSDYSIFSWRTQQPHLPSDPDAPSVSSSGTDPEPSTIHIRDPAEPLPSPPTYCNPSYYTFKQASRSRAHSTAGSSHKRTIRSTKSHKTKASKHDHANDVPAFKREFDKFHEENGVRMVRGSIGPVNNVRFLLKSGYRNVYISRNFAKEHGFIPADAAPGHYGYGGLVSIGTWPITLIPSSEPGEVALSPTVVKPTPASTPSQLIGPSRHPTTKTHGAAALAAASASLQKAATESNNGAARKPKVVHMPLYLSEEPHFSVVLGRAFFEKRQIHLSNTDPTEVLCLDNGDRIECELVVLKDGKGSIVTVTLSDILARGCRMSCDRGDLPPCLLPVTSTPPESSSSDSSTNLRALPGIMTRNLRATRTTSIPASPDIAHATSLRTSLISRHPYNQNLICTPGDLVICPRESGTINCVQSHSIVEHKIHSLNSAPRVIANLPFTPNTLTSLQVDGGDKTLLAAGGQEAELYLSLQSNSTRRRHPAFWEFNKTLHGSINNSVSLTSLARSNESSVEPRILISNNSNYCKLYDIPLRGVKAPQDIAEAGALHLNMPINHSSISPDGRVLLSVGDSSKVHLHRLTGGSRVTFSHITTLDVPAPNPLSVHCSSSALSASFSSAWSSSGSKFAVASQEGVVAVWDVRSSVPLKVLQTDNTRVPTHPLGNGSASGYISEDPWDWTHFNTPAPGWSVRTVKFGNGGINGSGNEVMAFAEHTNHLHILDARTFETEEIIRVPSAPRSSLPPPPSVPKRQSQRSSLAASQFSHARRRSASPQRLSSLGTFPTLNVRAMESTFRISPSSLPDSIHWRRPGEHRRQEEEADVMVIPSFSDHTAEDDLHALLLSRRVAATQSRYENNLPRTLPQNVILEYDEPAAAEMTVDELESEGRDLDCVLTAHTRDSSRASSSTLTSRPLSPNRLSSPSPNPEQISYDDCTKAGDNGNKQRDDDDIAGLCFDPTGKFVYVATAMQGITEWSLPGAEKRWWGMDGFV